MEGLEDQAEAALGGLLQQLRCDQRVEIGRSSRDMVISHIAKELKNEQTVTKSLVIRGGISMNGLAMLQQGLEENDTIEELQFVCLKTVQELQGAIDCCRRQPRIRSLSLKSYTPPTSRRIGEGSEVIAATIRDCLFGVGRYWQDDEDSLCRRPGSGIPTLRILEIEAYPIGTGGLEVLVDSIARNTTLETLRLLDCDLRSDSVSSVANMIKRNNHLKELDLSYNRQYLGSEITRELTLKTLVQRGLRYNMSLLELKLEQTRGGPIKRGHRQLVRHLDISKFRAAFVDLKRDPFEIPAELWTYVLARVALKPSALYLFLQESAVTIFR